MKTIKITWANGEYPLEISDGVNAPKTIADDIIIRAIRNDTKDYYFTADGRLTWNVRTASGRISTRLNKATCRVTVEGFAYRPYVAGGYMRYAWVAERKRLTAPSLRKRGRCSRVFSANGRRASFSNCATTRHAPGNPSRSTSIARDETDASTRTRCSRCGRRKTCWT